VFIELNQPVQMIGHDNPGKGNNITLFMQVSEFTNQQACCGDIREQGMAITGNRGDAIDLMLQGMTPPAQCVVGQGDLLVSNGNDGCWPNEFGPTTVIYPLDMGKSLFIYNSKWGSEHNFR
jgi:hypothetical protein